MTVRIVHKNSSRSAVNPTPGQLANGELAVNYNEDGPFISVRDDSGRIVRVGGVWINRNSPPNPAHASLWVDTDNNLLFIWDDDANSWRQLSGAGGGGGGGGGAVDSVTSGQGINHTPVIGTGNVVISANINDATDAGGGGLEFNGNGEIQINVGNGLDISATGELVSTIGALSFQGIVDCTLTVAANGVDGLGAGDAGNTWVNTAGPGAAANASWGFPGGTTVDAGDMVIWDGTGWVLVPTGGGVGSTDLAVINRTATTLDIQSSTGTDATVPFADEQQAGLFIEPDNTNNDTTGDFVRRSVNTGGTQVHSWQEVNITDGTVTSITPGLGLRNAADANEAGNDNDTPITGAGFIGLSNTAVTAGTFGDATNVPQITVDAQGRLTAAADVAITFPASEITVQDEGAALATGAQTLNFVGDGVTATNAADATIKTITIPGGGGATVTVSETPPANPDQGDLWWNEDDGRLYVWYEETGGTNQWVDASPAGTGGGGAAGANVTIGETPPANPDAGDLWWNEDTGRLFIFYDDGNTSQWVDASPAGGAGDTPNLQEVTDEGNHTTNAILIGNTAADPNISLNANGISDFASTLTIRNDPAGGANTGIQLNSNGGITASRPTNLAVFTGHTTGTAAATSTINSDGSAQFGDVDIGGVDGSGSATPGTGGLSLRASGNIDSYRATDVGNTTQFVLRSDVGAQRRAVIQFLSNGNATFTGTVTENGSDIKFKNQTRSVPTSQLEDIKNLQLKEWTWTEDAPGNEEIKARRNRGLIAQEAELVDPKLVYEVEFEDRDGYKAIDHQVLIMKLLGAVQELEAEVAALKGGS